MPAERNPGTRERFAQNGGLRVGAVEDGEIGKGERRFPPTGAAAVDRLEVGRFHERPGGVIYPYFIDISGH